MKLQDLNKLIKEENIKISLDFRANHEKNILIIDIDPESREIVGMNYGRYKEITDKILEGLFNSGFSLFHITIYNNNKLIRPLLDKRVEIPYLKQNLLKDIEDTIMLYKIKNI